MADNDDPILGKKLFPSPTAGDGRIRANSKNDGSGQGKGSAKRFGKCKHCGFVNNFKAIAIGGGSESGKMGYGAVTKATGTGTLLNGSTFTEATGDQTVKKGAGCALCGSKNSATEKPD